MKTRSILLSIIASVSLIPTGSAQVASDARATPDLAPATIEGTRQFDLTSTINGEAYRVQIFIPSRPPAATGYPVLYLLDGNVLFGTYAAAARTKALAREAVPAVVVGIASGQGPTRADRNLDFTIGPRSAREVVINHEMSADQKVGGAEAFFRVVQEEIRPRVEQIVPLDNGHSALLGWSLAGLFVTRTLLSHPDAFGTYIAISPSLWYGDRAVLGEIDAFAKRAAVSGIKPRMFLAAGGREEELPAAGVQAGVSRADLVAELKYFRMVHNPQDLTVALAPYFGRGALRFKLFKQDTHNSIPWSAVNPALDFAFSPPPGR